MAEANPLRREDLVPATDEVFAGGRSVGHERSSSASAGRFNSWSSPRFFALAGPIVAQFEQRHCASDAGKLPRVSREKNRKYLRGLWARWLWVVPLVILSIGLSFWGE